MVKKKWIHYTPHPPPTQKKKKNHLKQIPQIDSH